MSVYRRYGTSPSHVNKVIATTNYVCQEDDITQQTLLSIIFMGAPLYSQDLQEFLPDVITEELADKIEDFVDEIEEDKGLLKAQLKLDELHQWLINLKVSNGDEELDSESASSEKDSDSEDSNPDSTVSNSDEELDSESVSTEEESDSEYSVGNEEAFIKREALTSRYKTTMFVLTTIPWLYKTYECWLIENCAIQKKSSQPRNGFCRKKNNNVIQQEIDSALDDLNKAKAEELAEIMHYQPIEDAWHEMQDNQAIVTDERSDDDHCIYIGQELACEKSGPDHYSSESCETSSEDDDYAMILENNDELPDYETDDSDDNASLSDLNLWKYSLGEEGSLESEYDLRKSLGAKKWGRKQVKRRK